VAAWTVEMLAFLPKFKGEPKAFWSIFIKGVSLLYKARRGFIMVKETDSAVWTRAGVWPLDDNIDDRTSALLIRAQEMSAIAHDQGYFAAELLGSLSGKKSGVMVAMRLEIDHTQSPSVVVLLLDNQSNEAMSDLEIYFKLVSQIPAIYQRNRFLQQAENDVVHLSNAMDMMLILNEQERYMGAAMGVCNELAARFDCVRVTIGWLEGGYVKVQAISHTEKFDDKMSVVQSLEMVMEEAFDQDEEILWPEPEKSDALARDHCLYSREQAVPFLLSIPLRLGSTSTGVIVCERVEVPFSQSQVRGLRVISDIVTRRLADLKLHDRWFGARWIARAKDQLGNFFKIQQTGAKLLGSLIFLFLVYAAVGTWVYRVEGPFILKSDDLVYLPAPFDGYIDEVNVHVGDVIKYGQLLLKMDNTELLLDRFSINSDISRYSREIEKARAQNSLADMRIAQAQRDQSLTTFKRIAYRLSNASIYAPFNGVVVEDGDLKQKRGASVRKGDILFKVSVLDKMYVQIDIKERDIHEIALGQVGKISFVSRPNEQFPFRIKSIEPVATPKEEGNVFRLRGETTMDDFAWWRPGMTGLARIDMGKRNIMWILSHRTVDFIRLWLWW